MKTTALAASSGGDPFASEIDRALWDIGYPNDFDTEAEAREAIAELCMRRPEFRAATFTMEVV